jgi:GNAT superfamily N-acetyltransferase
VGFDIDPHILVPNEGSAMSPTPFTIDELPIPESLDTPGGDAFREMVAVRNEVEGTALGSMALAVTPEELLPVFQKQQFDPKRLFLARIDGRIVARGVLAWSNEEGSRLAWPYADVLPAFRRRGIGTALFDLMEGIAVDMGRSVIQTDTIHTTEGEERIHPPTGFGSLPASDDGVRFLRKRGYSLEQIGRISFLDLPIDPALLARNRAEAEAKAGPDYRLLTWLGVTPPEWRSDLAYLKNRMSVDMPAADLEVDEETWTEERIVAHDEAEVAGGRPLLVTVALHVPTNRLVGINELSVSNDRTRPVGQEDTLVLQEHRGHRLGMLLKVANLQELAQIAPDAPLVFTFNAEENRPMLDVNEAVGFRAVGYDGSWQKILAG